MTAAFDLIFPVPLAVVPLVVGGLLVGYVAWSAAAAAWQAHQGQDVGPHALADALRDRLALVQSANKENLALLESQAEARARAKAATSRQAAARIGTLAKFYAGLNWVMQDIASAIEQYAATATDVIGWQGRVVIPRVDERAKRAGKQAGAAAGAAAAANAALKRFRKAQGKTDAKQNDRTLDALNRAKGAHRTAREAKLGAHAAKDLAHNAQRTAQKALARTTPVAMAGTIAAVMIGRLGFKWWRCSKFRAFGRNLTCSHWSFLQDLLFLPLLALVVTDACRLSDEVARVGDFMDKSVMQPLVGITDNICRSGAGTKASASDEGGYSGEWRPTAV